MYLSLHGSLLLASVLLAYFAEARNVLRPQYARNGTQAACAGTLEPTTFFLRDITYIRYEASPYTGESPPNGTTLAFEVVNKANGISTGCAVQNVMSQGQWKDDSVTWQSCLDRPLTIGGSQFTVKTSAQFSWNTWQLTINQTWNCDERTTSRRISRLALEPACTESKTPYQYVKECTAPDIEAAATPQ
ncbi:hypothetical protein F4780DRAFT_719148 [Xylariomycetidae sp. FL0641]|nr:hypothetical protein F4780DRAFT_719148 [Xylariomycetidae sp. FL0641]